VEILHSLLTTNDFLVSRNESWKAFKFGVKQEKNILKKE